jgi:hypothetical protein
MALTHGSMLLVWSSLFITGTFAIFEVTSGECYTSNAGSCVASTYYYAGWYPANDQCTIRMTSAGCITSGHLFDTAAGSDTVNVRRRGSTYSGTTSFSDVWLDAGDLIEWSSDSWCGGNYGWEFCISTSPCVNDAPTPTPTPTESTVTQTYESTISTIWRFQTYSVDWAAEFDSVLQTAFTETVAELASTSAASVVIDSISDASRRSGGACTTQYLPCIEVQYSVTASQASVSNLVNQMDDASSSGFAAMFVLQAAAVGMGIHQPTVTTSLVSSAPTSAAPTSAASEECCDISSSACNAYMGDCGALSERSSCWATIESLDYCYAEEEGECCDTDVGAIAGICIGILVFVACAVCACCFLCSSCPLGKKTNQVAVQPQPVQQIVLVPAPAPAPMAAQPIAMVAQRVPAPQSNVPPQPGMHHQPTPGLVEISDDEDASGNVPTPGGGFCQQCGAQKEGVFCGACGGR